MIDWLHSIFGNSNPTNGALKEQTEKTAKKSEEILKENANTLSALQQIRNVEQIARDR